MEAKIQFSQVPVNDADDNFEKNFRFKLEDFLRNECILDPQGIQRVVHELRHLYIRTCYQANCLLMVPGTADPKLGDHHGAIMQYLQEYGPGVCDSMLKALTEVRMNMLKETARQLAYLDEKHNKRLAN
ncbi:hypothetical protein IFT48_04150 [Pseudomonas fluorescens]|uniref:hypothetical protein n=1 Tax=Pseudomonas fluorescens TaxID=294 RepID=UPI001930E15D|nr:hypothetical protein [Pseudomonas fluorescens]MBD8089164.1 hypothetical protein [Pseudomonas fluorescens]